MTMMPGSPYCYPNNGFMNFPAYQAFPLNNPGNPYAQYNCYPMTMGYPYMDSQCAQGMRLASMYGEPLPDTFERNFSEYGEGKASYRKSIVDSAKNVKDKVSNSPTVWKGVVGTGIILTTLICLLNGKKPTPVASGPSFWSKLNPINWFKK